MKLEKLVGERFKERPSDCVIDSHALMIRGGYVKNVANGIFSLYMPMRRITRKIEQIIREEMDAVDGQEVLFPVALPASLWEESGRWESVGSELLRFTDRNDSPMLLGMTHEEAAVHLVREYGQSHAKYPFMVYQFQTKFRDEARPRGGLIRVREFTMKDAYSFHLTQEDLERCYAECYAAYERIFARAGIPETIVVASDSGMMGGKIAHEYMLLTPIGEDSLAICGSCDFRANMEAAPCTVENDSSAEMQPLTEVHTPNIQTIEDVCTFLDMPQTQSCKAVIYQKNATDEYVVIFLRGDLELNETKLTNFLGEVVHPAVITAESGIHAGYTGPVGITENCSVLFDSSLAGTRNFSCGANREEYHYIGLCVERDCPGAEFHDFAKIPDGGICPNCGKKAISIQRGIEVGNIFQLGVKYTKAMDMTYLDAQGQQQYPIMGCYGIGVGRLAAAVCESHHDDYGPIWPMAIAPWQVQLCCVRVDDAHTKALADSLYKDLQTAGVEVLYDDRAVSAGYMFSDADLLGIPLRVIASPRNLKEGVCEFAARDKSFTEKIPTGEIVSAVKAKIAELLG